MLLFVKGGAGVVIWEGTRSGVADNDVGVVERSESR